MTIAIRPLVGRTAGFLGLIWGSGKEEYFPRRGLTGRLKREGTTHHDRITAPPNPIYRSAQDDPLRLLLLEFRDCLYAIGLRDGKLDLIANLQSIEKQPVARFEILPSSTGVRADCPRLGLLNTDRAIGLGHDRSCDRS